MPGGESGGWFKREKVSMLPRVSRPATIPTNSGIAVNNINDLVLDCKISPPGICLCGKREKYATEVIKCNHIMQRK